MIYLNVKKNVRGNSIIVHHFFMMITPSTNKTSKVASYV
jgi:hypothetical protein